MAVRFYVGLPIIRPHHNAIRCGPLWSV